ncbi:DUF4244 domain-containing protein [Trueperella pyogenes]|uniref:DUF4244 domain-containing protein n=2 Tax=Trueperella pyogenes TaxID=1661 RepID=UPI000F85AC70|nr:DUF4244 domain-containing protein [Trueperella pyogenes]
MMKHMKKMLVPQVESGMVSAEYAVGTVATTSIAGLLIWIIQQDWFRDGLVAIFKLIFKFS